MTGVGGAELTIVAVERRARDALPGFGVAPFDAVADVVVRAVDGSDAFGSDDVRTGHGCVRTRLFHVRTRSRSIWFGHGAVLSSYRDGVTLVQDQVLLRVNGSVEASTTGRTSVRLVGHDAHTSAGVWGGTIEDDTYTHAGAGAAGLALATVDGGVARVGGAADDGQRDGQGGGGQLGRRLHGSLSSSHLGDRILSKHTLCLPFYFVTQVFCLAK